MINKIIISILLLLMLVNVPVTQAAGDIWISDTSIVTGLGDVGDISCPIVFLDGSTLKLISGSIGGDFYGWQRSGSTWVSNSSIVTGLGSVGNRGVPTVFDDGGTLKLISGEYGGIFHGWDWSGSTWVSNSSIVTGLGDVGARSIPTVFLDGSTLKLISGENDGDFHGYYWSGSSWISDVSVVTGLGDIGSRSSPTVYLNGSTLKLIAGEYDNEFNGWYWSGSSWISDASIITGIEDETYMHPTVFLDDSTQKLIMGSFEGIFYGWYLEDTFSISGTVTDASGAVNNTTITLSDSAGSTTSNEIGYYEITGILPETYTISATEILHHNYSDSVSITGDTEKDIFLTLIYTDPTPTAPPVAAIQPYAEETPTIPLLIEEEPLTVIFEEIMSFIMSTSSWIFIFMAYIGATIAKLIINKEENSDTDMLVDVLLYGTIGWIAILFVNIFISIIAINEIFSIIIFFASGFIITLLFNSKD